MRNLLFKSAFGAIFVELDSGKGTAGLLLPYGLAVLEEVPLTYGTLPGEDPDSDDAEPRSPALDWLGPGDCELVDGEAGFETSGVGAGAVDGFESEEPKPRSMPPVAEAEAFAFAHLVRLGRFELLATVAAPTGAFEPDTAAACATGGLFSGFVFGSPPLSLPPVDEAPAT